MDKSCEKLAADPVSDYEDRDDVARELSLSSMNGWTWERRRWAFPRLSHSGITVLQILSERFCRRASHSDEAAAALVAYAFESEKNRSKSRQDSDYGRAERLTTVLRQMLAHRKASRWTACGAIRPPPLLLRPDQAKSDKSKGEIQPGKEQATSCMIQPVDKESIHFLKTIADAERSAS